VSIPLCEALDVVAHEITHGITSFESNLVYVNEAGALNEAMSDIMAAAIDRSAGASVADTWLVGEDVWTPNTAGDALRSMSNPTLFGHFDYYPERYQGSEDNGGVHLNSGIANLAFVLMVQGGQHPRGKTTFQVPAIDSNFDVSMDIASEIFYNANTQCLTPGSDFAALRFCTAEVISESIYRDTINAAWKAVGVCDGCGSSDTIVLTDGVPLENQAGQTGDVQQYVLENVSAGTAVTCSLAGSNGDADLYVGFGGQTGPGEEFDCSSLSPTSNEECTVGPSASSTDLYVAIYAFSGYSGLQITCASCNRCSDLNPYDTIALTDGVPLDDQEGQTGDVQQYVLENVSAGATATCLLSGSNGDADLYMQFDGQTGPGLQFDCVSGSPNSNEECTVGPAASNMDLYAAIHAYSGYNSLQITCTCDGCSDPNTGAIALTDGVPLENQEGQTGDIQNYILENISAGASVTCSLVGSSGDADLFVRLGGLTGPGEAYDCASVSSTSNEECTVGPVAQMTDLYVAIYAYGSYTDLQITCSTGRDNLVEVDVTLVLVTDSNPSETTVLLVDLSTSDTYWADEEFSAQETEYTLTQQIDATHCLLFVINDSSGNGICCEYGAGSFDLRYDDQSVFFGGEFGDSNAALVGGGCV